MTFKNELNNVIKSCDNKHTITIPKYWLAILILLVLL